MIAKNEAPYLLEWVAYHRLLGFDTIVIYDNLSTDGSTELLAGLHQAGVIEHRMWTLGKDESPQVTAYQHALRRVQTDWLYIIDADEFLVLHQHATVGEFLAGFAQRPEVSSIGINWRVFGDNGLVDADPRPVIERFTQASLASFGPNCHLKSFARVAQTQRAGIHVGRHGGLQVHASGQPLTMPTWGLSAAPEFSVAQVNHYYGKTLGEFLAKKANRGRAGVAESSALKFHYSPEKFKAHNRNDEPDLAILRHLDAVKAEMQALSQALSQGLSHPPVG